MILFFPFVVHSAHFHFLLTMCVSYILESCTSFISKIISLVRLPGSSLIWNTVTEYYLSLRDSPFLPSPSHILLAKAILLRGKLMSFSWKKPLTGFSFNSEFLYPSLKYTISELNHYPHFALECQPHRSFLRSLVCKVFVISEL